MRYRLVGRKFLCEWGIQMTKEKFVVFVQDMDKTYRVNDVYGPFYSYDKAESFCRIMRQKDKMDNVWLGIRRLEEPDTVTSS